MGLLMWLLLTLGCVPEPEKPDDLDADGFSELEGDCDDGDGARFPGAPEHCDGVDEDCDGATDEDPVDAPTRYVDGDGDGVGSGAPVQACGATGADTGGDCDDGDASVYPGAPERCDDTVDQDCTPTAAGCVPEGDVPLAADLELPSDGESTFATTVAVVGDQTGDGLADVAVAAPMRGAPTDAEDTPFVWIYSAAGDGRLTTAQADATVVGFPSNAMLPGWSLAGGDLDGDGQADLVLGAPGNYEGLYDFGSVHLLRGPITGARASAGYPTDVAYAATEDAAVYLRGEAHDDYGAVVAVLSDLDGDGFPEVGVGAPSSTATDPTLHPGGAPSSGMAYAYPGAAAFPDRDPDAITRVFGDVGYAEVGRTMSSLPDVDGDGLGEWIVGSPSHDEGRGSFALFRAPEGDVSFAAAELRVVGAAVDDRLGTAFAWLPLSGELLVGAANDVSDTPNTGAVWAIPFDALTRGTLSVDEVGTRRLEGAPGDQFAFAMSTADVDGDDAVDLVVGAPGAGRVDVWTGEGLRWGLTGLPLSVGVGFAGFDGDGDPFEDLLVGDPFNNRALVWRGHGE